MGMEKNIEEDQGSQDARRHEEDEHHHPHEAGK